MNPLHKALYELYQGLIKALPAKKVVQKDANGVRIVPDHVVQTGHDAFVQAHTAARQAGASSHRAYQAGYDAHQKVMATHPPEDRVLLSPPHAQNIRTFAVNGVDQGAVGGSPMGEARHAYRLNIADNDVYVNGESKGKNTVTHDQRQRLLGGR